jgi:CspA family cold shock protein
VAFLFAETPSTADTRAVHLSEGGDVASGTVKWFNGQKGYGFIQPDTGGKDVFVHVSAVERAGLSGLPDGAKVTYDVVQNKGKESAENLKLK